MAKQPDEPALRIHGADHRGEMFAKIAAVHRQIAEAKWKAGMIPDGKFQISPQIVLHLDEAVHFLAEEMLRLSAMVEGNCVTEEEEN